MPPPLNVFLSQSMQRKVNRSDSDYHYGEEKHKQNVVIMMRKCKIFLRENTEGNHRLPSACFPL
ncbi:hypothetical protein CRG96_08875 [Escherichia sp. E4930]|nr:hypothetical protein CRG96_08875 [Escherichia sp. E4930]TGC05883.1 hypothetical protein CRI63_01380 [Escherichia sp. E2661]